MAQLIGGILVIMLAIAIIIKFKTFFIIAAILSVAAIIAVNVIKKRKAKAVSSEAPKPEAPAQMYAKYFVSKPARSCVAVKTLPKNVLVEVELIAEV